MKTPVPASGLVHNPHYFLVVWDSGVPQGIGEESYESFLGIPGCSVNAGIRVIPSKRIKRKKKPVSLETRANQWVLPELMGQINYRAQDRTGPLSWSCLQA